MPRLGQKAQPSVKSDWGRDLRGNFIAKLLRCGWTHYRDCKRFGSEIYQKNHSRIEIDGGGVWVWEQFIEGHYSEMIGCFSTTHWVRTHGLCNDDIDRIRDDYLLFVEPGVMRWRKFDLARGEWI